MVRQAHHVRERSLYRWGPRWGVVLLPFFLAVCGENDLGGSEAGNSPSRLMTGTVPDDDSGQNRCAADTVVATSNDSDTVAGPIGTDCTFSVELVVGTPYTVTFERDSEFVAAMEFQNSADSLATPYVVLASGSEPVDLGRITFENGTATPETEPATQNDLDGDGEGDFSDTDDDNSNTTGGDGSGEDETDGDDNEGDDDTDDASEVDLENVDCDLDGIDDAIDTDLSACADEEEDDAEDEEVVIAQVLQVTPVNLAGISSVLPAVSLSSKIKVRVDCPVALSSATADTFRVTSTGGAVACSFALESGDTIVSCTPGASLSLATTYSVSVSGLTCGSGNSVESASWSFKTLSLNLLGLGL